MGLEKLGLSLAQKTSVWVKNVGKTNILQSKPINLTKLQNSHLAPDLAFDTIQLTNNSYISESFVKSLTQMKGKDNIETATLIKNAILKKMGYKNPELLKLEKASFFSEMRGMAAGWCNESGKMILGDYVLNSPIKDQLIPTLYHELDHMDKFIKLYKATGEKKYYEILAENIGKERNPKINFDFFKKMSEDVDITDFDVNKYINAARKYETAGPRFSQQYKYFNNPFEVSAYDLESKIRNILKTSTLSPTDVFPKNYISLVDALKKQDITDVLKQDETLLHIIEICKMKYIDKNLLLSYRNVINQTATPEETERVMKVFKEIMQNPKEFVPKLQKAYLDAEACINEGLLTVDDIVNHLSK